MCRIILLVSVVPVIQSIIVTDPPPTEADYKYSYNVVDPSTGDSKSQYEVRHGDTVSGAYSLIDPDGTKRTVEYSADPTYGFKAIVRQEPINNDLSKRPLQNSNNINYRYDPELAKQVYTNEKPVMELSNRHIIEIPYYPKTVQGYRQPAVYFTPEDEILQESLQSRKQYFSPAYNL